MAIWNAPADDADHVAHACAAVLACREANRKLNEEFEREGWPAYRTRFGLHTGEAVVGTIGSSDRMAYTVLGATVNLAARLEPLNKDYGTEILVSDAVRQRVADRFVFRMVDTIQPKGFEATIRVYELCGEVQERLRAEAEHGGDDTHHVITGTRPVMTKEGRIPNAPCRGRDRRTWLVNASCEATLSSPSAEPRCRPPAGAVLHR
jgi:hypothetical protein